jgi:oligoendopeptidase F
MTLLKPEASTPLERLAKSDSSAGGSTGKSAAATSATKKKGTKPGPKKGGAKKGGTSGRNLPRSEVSVEDTWDLSSLFPTDEQWEQLFAKFQRKIRGFEKYKGRLDESAKTLASCLKFDAEVDRIAERLGAYAFLRTAEDQANSEYQRMMGRFQTVATQAGQLASFIRPEILALSEERMKEYLAAPELKRQRLQLERILRYRPHTLSDKEEQLLAMQGEMSQVAARTFRQLHDADLKFGTVEDEHGNQLELTNATFSKLLHSPDRQVRKRAFHQYYEQFAAHENSLASLLFGSVQTDVYYARVRGYSSALDQALFSDDVPLSVYDGLIEAVHRNLPALYRYYDLRRRKMKLRGLHHYDTYVPILSEIKWHRPWNEAVDMILEALEPLGSDYTAVLAEGLRGRWCDRYPNQGKLSGAFSYGTYDSDPYIMMNYKPDVLDDLFTLAHEAGHSMHTYYSAGKQPFLYYNYTIFVAEVASTFNEQLLGNYLRREAQDDRQRAYLINRELDAVRATIFRQTMFAEFEKLAHERAEAGEPLTVEAFKEIYRGLLELYFGPDFQIDDQLALECFRIPHFYRAFYVYKYATGMSAAIALSQRVLEGSQKELRQYLGFLEGGCSKFPLELLRDAGVDMASPEPVDAALRRFGELVDELDALL